MSHHTARQGAYLSGPLRRGEAAGRLWAAGACGEGATTGERQGSEQTKVSNTAYKTTRMETGGENLLEGQNENLLT